MPKLRLTPTMLNLQWTTYRCKYADFAITLVCAFYNFTPTNYTSNTHIHCS